MRRRVEGAALLLVLPLAVGLTALSVAPSSSSTPVGRVAAGGDGLSVALAGPEPVATYTLADRLSAQGYDLTTVSASSDKSLSVPTVVVYYQRERRADAVRLRDLLGGGTIRLDSVLEPSSDFTVLLGKDPQRT